MSKYLKITVLIALGVGSLGAENFQLPSLNELRAKINKDEENYNYVEVNNQSEYNDLIEERGEDLGLSLENDGSQEVINIVRIRNVTNRGRYLHHSSSSTNLGLEYIGDMSNIDITNVVEVENSSLNGIDNIGISASNDSSTISSSSISTSATISNSSINK